MGIWSFLCESAGRRSLVDEVVLLLCFLDDDVGCVYDDDDEISPPSLLLQTRFSIVPQILWIFEAYGLLEILGGGASSYCAIHFSQYHCVYLASVFFVDSFHRIHCMFEGFDSDPYRSLSLYPVVLANLVLDSFLSILFPLYNYATSRCRVV